MKPLLYAFGAALALINGGIAFFPAAGMSVLVHMLSAVLGIAVLMTVAKASESKPAAPTREPAPARPAPAPAPAAAGNPVAVSKPLSPAAPVPVPAPIPVAAPVPAARAEAEVVAFLAMLQDKGRLVDFVREDITGASDAQVGAAARVVHAGCRQVLSDCFEIAPVRTEPESGRVVLTAGYDAAAHRLLGSVPAQPPYTGTLLHPGWKVVSLKLPRVTGTTPERPWPVLAPAEVQVG
ncbi:MAG: DUF2760 domain-containing protein [Opitutaceae bacterium]